MILWQLFIEFFKVGLFSFGGALASVPFLREMAERTGWFTSAQLADIVAVSQTAPGPIGVNIATNAGYLVAGIKGGIIATLGIISPSVIIMIIVTRVLRSLNKNKMISSAFYGLRAASVGLISAAGFEIIKVSLLIAGQSLTLDKLALAVDWTAVIFAAVLFFLMDSIKAHPAFFLALSAIVGAALRLGGQ